MFQPKDIVKILHILQHYLTLHAHRWLVLVKVGFDIRIGADVRRHTARRRERRRGIAWHWAVLIGHARAHCHLLRELPRVLPAVLRIAALMLRKLVGHASVEVLPLVGIRGRRLSHTSSHSRAEVTTWSQRLLRWVLRLESRPAAVSSGILRAEARLAAHVLRFPLPHEHRARGVRRVSPLVARCHLARARHLAGAHLRAHHVGVHAHIGHLCHWVHASHGSVSHLPHAGHSIHTVHTVHTVHAAIPTHAHTRHARVMAALLTVAVHRTVLGISHRHVALHLKRTNTV